MHASHRVKIQKILEDARALPRVGGFEVLTRHWRIDTAMTHAKKLHFSIHLKVPQSHIEAVFHHHVHLRPA
jgi:hypothetical protein